MEAQDVQDVVEVLAVEALRDIGLALLSHINTKDGHATPNASEALDRLTS
jgi:hypothetical protein